MFQRSNQSNLILIPAPMPTLRSVNTLSSDWKYLYSVEYSFLSYRIGSLGSCLRGADLRGIRLVALGLCFAAGRARGADEPIARPRKFEAKERAAKMVAFLEEKASIFGARDQA